jgi:hypothetical protein
VTGAWSLDWTGIIRGNVCVGGKLLMVIKPGSEETGTPPYVAQVTQPESSEQPVGNSQAERPKQEAELERNRYVALKAFLLRRVMPVCMWLSAFGLLVTTGVALWIGSQDLFLPVSLSAQFLGLAYFFAGLMGLAGLAGLASLAGLAGSLADLARRLLGEKPEYRGGVNQHERGWGRKRKQPPTWQVAFVFGGAVAGCYVDTTIVWYSLGYHTIITWIFIVLAVLCFFLACVMLPAIRAVWKYIAGSLKGLGISAALLAVAAQFWYVSVYAPENAPAAVNASFAIRSITGTGSNRVAQVDVTLENTGSVPAVALGSVLLVYGVSFPSGSKTLLRVLPPYSNSGWLFPNNPISYDIPVRLTKSAINALDFELSFNFARTTWLTLGQRRGSKHYYTQGCILSPSFQQFEWYIVQSHVRAFAQGAVVLYSHYCKDPTDQNITIVKVGFVGVRGRRFVAIPDRSAGPGLGIIADYQSETILLG